MNKSKSNQETREHFSTDTYIGIIFGILLLCVCCLVLSGMMFFILRENPMQDIKKMTS
jgi:hypothetical protein